MWLQARSTSTIAGIGCGRDGSSLKRETAARSGSTGRKRHGRSRAQVRLGHRHRQSWSGSHSSCQLAQTRSDRKPLAIPRRGRAVRRRVESPAEDSKSTSDHRVRIPRRSLVRYHRPSVAKDPPALKRLQKVAIQRRLAGDDTAGKPRLSPRDRHGRRPKRSSTRRLRIESHETPIGGKPRGEPPEAQFRSETRSRKPQPLEMHSRSRGALEDPGASCGKRRFLHAVTNRRRAPQTQSAGVVPMRRMEVTTTIQGVRFARRRAPARSRACCASQPTILTPDRQLGVATGQGLVPGRWHRQAQQ